MRSVLKKIPGLAWLVKKIRRIKTEPFDSTRYWQQRYRKGGNSGGKQYTQTTEFKIDYLNKLVEDKGIETIIEFGCGDGDVLSNFKVKQYTGLDVSSDVIDLCKRRFKSDSSKKFYTVDQYTREHAELTLSFDVIYHLVENHIFEEYMKELFALSKRFVLIHTSNNNSKDYDTAIHVRHRNVTDWVNRNILDFKLVHIEVNPQREQENPDDKYLPYIILYEKLLMNDHT